MAKRKYDWIELKKEFLQGDWLTVADFLRENEIPLSNQVNTTGWIDDKKEKQRESLIASTDAMVEQDTQNIVEARKRQARLSRFMQLKGAKAMQDLEVDDVGEARKLLVDGLKEERKVLGMGRGSRGEAKNLTQFNINFAKTNFDKLLESADYEGILRLIADVRRERDRRFGEEASPGSEQETEKGRTV